MCLATAAASEQDVLTYMYGSNQGEVHTCANVVPVGVVWCELLEGASLNNVDPSGDLELAGTLEVGCICGDERLRAVRITNASDDCLLISSLACTHLMSRTPGILGRKIDYLEDGGDSDGRGVDGGVWTGHKPKLSLKPLGQSVQFYA